MARLLFAFLLLGSSTAAFAQRGTWEFGVTGAYSLFTPFLDDEQTGIGNAPSAKVFWRPGASGGLQVGYHARDRIGLRLNTSYTDRAVTGSDLDGVDFVSSTNLWAASLDVLYRLKSIQPSGMNPFVVLGLGLQSTNPGLDTFNCRAAGGGETHACVPMVTGGVPGTPNSRTWALREQLAPSFALGVGADLRFDRAVFLRAELSDRVFKPAVHRAEQAGAEWDLTSDASSAKLVHQIGLTVGVHFRLGSPHATDMAQARAQSLKAATEADEVEPCPEISFWDPTQFQSAPVRASVVGTVTTARRALQTALGKTSYRHAQSDKGSVITDWSPVYADPGQGGRLRKHALFFEFVPEMGGTDIVMRWLMCSSPAPDGGWVVTLADRFARPPDIAGLMAAIRQR